MKKLRKGFTLLELLVVIGVMGILSSTAMIAGQQATDAARATTIADNLEKAASAMMMYYADNADDIAVSTTTTAANVAAGANVYLKAADALASASAGNDLTVGKYTVVLTGTAPAQTWWIAYTLPDTDLGGVGAILKNKATRMELKASAADNAEAYAGEATVAMKVRGKTADEEEEPEPQNP